MFIHRLVITWLLVKIDEGGSPFLGQSTEDRVVALPGLKVPTAPGGAFSPLGPHDPCPQSFPQAFRQIPLTPLEGHSYDWRHCPRQE